MAKQCNHDNYSTSSEECDNTSHSDECVVTTCDNCNQALSHDFGTNGAVNLFAGETPESLNKNKIKQKFDNIVDSDKKATQEETDKKFHDIVSKIQFDEDK
jgi:hypothetical protein